MSLQLAAKMTFSLNRGKQMMHGTDEPLYCLAFVYETLHNREPQKATLLWIAKLCKLCIYSRTSVARTPLEP